MLSLVFNLVSDVHPNDCYEQRSGDDFVDVPEDGVKVVSAIAQPLACPVQHTEAGLIIAQTNEQFGRHI